LLLLLFVLGKIFNNYCHLWSGWGLRETVPKSGGSEASSGNSWHANMLNSSSHKSRGSELEARPEVDYAA